MKESITPDEVRTLAATADLPWEESRLGSAAELLSAWLPAANELSRKMSAEKYLEITPITVLVHPHVSESGE